MTDGANPRVRPGLCRGVVAAALPTIAVMVDPLADARLAFGRFVGDTSTALTLLFEAGLLTQLMVVMYSAIDAAGLLNAPLEQEDADGKSFKAWVDEYILKNSKTGLTADDLWGARCAVLHTAGSESSHSRKGKAREVAFFLGHEDEASRTRLFETVARTGRNLVPVNLNEFIGMFGAGLARFTEDFAARCREDRRWESRAAKLLSYYQVAPRP